MASQSKIEQRQHEEANPVETLEYDQAAQDLEDTRRMIRVLEKEQDALKAWQQALEKQNPVEAVAGDNAAAAMANERAGQLADKQAKKPERNPGPAGCGRASKPER